MKMMIDGKVYNWSNVVGILLASFGAGWFSIGSGFIVAGLLVVSVNIINVLLLKGK